MPFADIFRSILAIQGGVHPALFLLFVLGTFLAVWKLWKALRECENSRQEEIKRWAEDREKAFDKRMAEGQATLIALERNTVGLSTLITSVEARTQPVREMVEGLALLKSELDGSRDRFRDQANRMEGRQEEILRLLQDILRQRGSR